MKKIISILAVLAVAAVAALLFLKRERGPRYNLLFVTLDTTRADHLGCYGYPRARTPALDALARSGVTFTRTYCNVPLTLPSHATMMTGLYPPEHGCRINGAQGLAAGPTTLAQVFSSHGYQTAAFVAAFVLDSKFGLDRGFQTYDDFEVPAADDIYDENLMYRYRRGEDVADAALAWLEGHYRKPFFCWVHFFDPHRPYYIDESFKWSYRDKPYDDEVAYMDAQVARLIRFLEKRGLLERTLVVVLGDHGESLGEHDEDEHGLLLYNGAMRVPLIFSLGGMVPRGEEVGTLVSSVDIYPTILDLFGWEPRDRTSGRSFAGIFSGEQQGVRPVYAETEFPLTDYGWSPLRSVTTEDWKYVEAPREELYDLKADPGESRNLAGEKQRTLAWMKRQLAEIEGGMVAQEASAVKLDEQAQKILESLGYLGGGGARPDDVKSLRDPKDAIWMKRDFVKAVEAINAGRTAEAEGALKKLISESPETYTFRYRLGKMYYGEGNYAEARDEFRQLAEMYPDEFRTHYNLGKALMKTGAYGAAIKELRLALGFDPDQTSGYNNLGIALLRKGEVREAMEAFRKSISMDGGQVDPHNNLGNALLGLGRLEEAMAEFQRAVEVDPGFFEGRYNLGITLLGLTRYDEAAAEFRRAVEIRPGFAPARQKLGVALAKSGRMKEALVEFSRAKASSVPPAGPLNPND